MRNAIRRMRRTLGTLTVLGLLVAAPAAFAQAPGDSIPFNAEWVRFPEEPCVEDPIVLHVRGFDATPCDSFLGAHRAGERLVIVRRLTHLGRYCFAPPLSFFSVPIGFEPMPAGPRSITVRTHWLGLDRDGRLDSTVTESAVDFQVAPACAPPPLVSPGELPYVRTVNTVPSPACARAPTRLALAGEFPDGCGRVAYQSREGNRVTLAPFASRKTACTEALTPWDAEFPLGLLSAGSHRVGFELEVLGTPDWWPPIPTRRYRSELAFAVEAECDSALPGLPYVTEVRIGARRSGPLHGDTLILANPSICPDDSILVQVLGRFPDDCFQVRRVELLANPRMGPLPEPPIVRVLVDDRGCEDRPCRSQPVAWEAAAILAPLPARGYRLPLELAVVSCSDSIPPGGLFSSSRPFTVVPAESCSTAAPRCLAGDWARPGPVPCDAFLTSADPDSTELTFEIASGAPLAGLQGRLRWREPGLQITKLEAIGAAQGMRLTWTPENFGARFVLFAESGAPIPVSRGGVPVLRVTAEIAAIRVAWPDPPVFHLEAVDLLGADAAGGGVEDCNARVLGLFLPPTATVCIGSPCDFNADGATDVRDLVLMVRCWNGLGCPPGHGSRSADCDGSGRFGLPDVLCCAVRLLRAPGCPGCPVDTLRAEPSVRATFDPPRPTDHGLDVTLRLHGADRVGAGRLALKYPGDRYAIRAVELQGEASDRWLLLHETAGRDGLSLGLIGSAPPGAAAPPVEVVLRLERRPGAQDGGDLRLEGGEFSGPDGTMLDVDLGTPGRALGGGSPRLQLSAVRPTPAAGPVRFSVALEREARLDLAVYDLGGRRVAQVFQGERAAGTHEFEWDGTGSRGALQGGVYFLRAAAGTQVAVRRIVILRPGPPGGR